MCSDPQTFGDGKVGSCRNCNQCIKKRKHNWVARAMAEKLDWPHTLCLALTYDPSQSQDNVDAREFFVYDDIKLFLKRLRSDCVRYVKRHRLNIYPRLKFICAGEQGSKGDLACHWHMIIYSDLDLTKLGTVEGFKNYVKQVLTNRDDMISYPGGREKRLNWSLWGKGFVTFQEPDQGGMSYVMSYALKDQFTAEKSKGTMREAGAENYATGLFRPSKRPAIGENFLVSKMEALEASGSVLPNLKIKVPGMRGWWQPTGSFREKLLWFLVALNQRIKWATGRNAPQWSSLLQSCKDIPSDLEILNGPEKENPDDFVSFESEIHLKARQAAYYQSLGKAEGGNRPEGSCLCFDCLGLFTEAELAESGLWRVADTGGFYYLQGETLQGAAIFQHPLGCRHAPDGPFG